MLGLRCEVGSNWGSYSLSLLRVVTFIAAAGAGNTIDVGADEAQLDASAKPEVSGRASSRGGSERTFPGALRSASRTKGVTSHASTVMAWILPQWLCTINTSHVFTRWLK